VTKRQRNELIAKAIISQLDLCFLIGQIMSDVNGGDVLAKYYPQIRRLHEQATRVALQIEKEIVAARSERLRRN
jgi:hypothetical protein